MAFLSLPNGQQIIDQSGEFTQGWNQSLSTFNNALEGEYNRNRCTKSSSAITKNSFSPLVSVLYIKYEEDVASDILTFPLKLYGAIEVRDSSGTVTQTKHLEDANSITMTNINAGEFITGVLTKGN